MKKRVLFVIESLSGGGAEKVLSTIVKNIDKTKDVRQVGMTVIFEVIGNCTDEQCEDKIYKFLSGPFEMTEKEVRELDPEELLDKIFEIASVEKWKSFLSKASQFLK